MLKQLRKKQRLFVLKYIETWNATEAYRAVYGDHISRQVASSNGRRLLCNESVRAYVEKVLDERKRIALVDSVFVLEKLIEVIRADYVEGVVDMSEDEFQEMPKEVRLLVQGIKIKKKIYPDKTREKSYEVTFMNKDRAIQLLGKYLGLFLDKVDVNSNVNVKGKTFADSVARIFDKMNKVDVDDLI